MTKDCLVCSEELFYNTNIQKINCFEDELWFNYTNFKQQNQANKTNQQNYDLFYNIYGYEQNADFDKYMANLNSSKQQNLFITDEEMCEDLNLEHYYINYYNNNMNNSTKKQLDNIDINIAIPQSFQNQNQNLNENLTITKSMISAQDGEKKQKFVVNKTKSEKTKEKEKIKYKIPFFKEFNIKFTKRENIDKKILRKFRKFLKDKMKKNAINWYVLGLNSIQKEFWINFIGENLMPPMKYKDITESIEFKSFNTNYMVWLLTHKGSVELYNNFINERQEDVADTFIAKYNLKNHEEIQQLNSYIKSLVYIFNSVKENCEETKQENNEEVEETTKKFNEKTIETQSNVNVNVNEREQDIINKITFDIFSADIYETNNKFDLNVKFDDFNNKMFNNSFDYDKDYMFNEE